MAGSRLGWTGAKSGLPAAKFKCLRPAPIASTMPAQGSSASGLANSLLACRRAPSRPLVLTLASRLDIFITNHFAGGVSMKSLLFIGTSLLVCAELLAQTTSTSILGTVTDTTGAAVSGIKVTAKNVGTNVQSVTLT